MLSDSPNGSPLGSLAQWLLPVAPAATVAALSAETSPAIARVYARFDGSAGSPFITAGLREQAEFAQLSRTRVAREMQTLGLRCRLRMAKKPRTTQSDPTHRVVGNQLDRCFRTEVPNQV